MLKSKSAYELHEIGNECNSEKLIPCSADKEKVENVQKSVNNENETLFNGNSIKFNKKRSQSRFFDDDL